MSERVTGYVLLSSGILIMIFTAFQIIGVFTGKAKPIEIFKMESLPISTSQTKQITQSNEITELLQQLQQSGESPQLNNLQLPSAAMPQLIDPKMLNSVLNMAVYYVIMQFLFSLGYKFSSLGVQMLRPIVVKVGEKRFETETSGNNTAGNSVS